VKILWVKANKLLPVHSGGDIRSFQIARHLAQSHDLTFFSYHDGQPDEKYEQELRSQLPGSVCICTGKSEGVAARTLDYFLRISSQIPYAVSRFECQSIRDRLKCWFEEQRFDVTICDFLDAAANYPAHLTIPSILFQHNVESEIWRRHAETEANPARTMMYRLEFRKMQAYEREAVSKFHHVIAVSEHDRQLMSRWVAPSRITVVPTGVDLQQYRPDPKASEDCCLVVFTGAMDWEPNIDAVEYFCNSVWPLILAAEPKARFRIVGRNPDRRVLKMKSSSVEVTGRVASVVEHLHQAAVIVVPLRIGGGTRLKIYEAMASGKVVVSTSVGAEGLDVHDGRDIVLADDPASFSSAVLRLLRDGQMRRSYEIAAAALASQYDWQAIGKRFATVLETVAGRSRSRSSYSAEEDSNVARIV
jgi:polysaccharide biosynthesis protein PslH